MLLADVVRGAASGGIDQGESVACNAGDCGHAADEGVAPCASRCLCCNLAKRGSVLIDGECLISCDVVGVEIAAAD